MKIAFIGQKGIPTIHGGGVERHVENLAVSLVKLGHEAIVYTRHSYTDKSLKEFKGVKLINLPSIPSKNLDAISHTFLACLNVIFKKVDVVHFHSIGPSSLIWLVKLFKPRTPVIATFHSQCYHNNKWGWFARNYLKFGEYICCTKSDRLITVSKYLAGHVKEKYQRDNVSYIPNGVNMPELVEPKEIKEKWGLDKNSYILYLGRLVRNKGIEYLIEAYKQLQTDKKLIIAGEGDFEEDLKAMAKDNKNIIFTGNQFGRSWAELYSNNYFFVQPSEAEGLSLALLEAMSYQNACLVSDIDANLEVVQDQGFSFKNRDINDLRDKMKELLNDEHKVFENKAKMLKRVKEEYVWDGIVLRILDLYQEVINKKKSK